MPDYIHTVAQLISKSSTYKVPFEGIVSRLSELGVSRAEAELCLADMRSDGYVYTVGESYYLTPFGWANVPREG